MNPCLCGCGQKVGNRFIKGHNARVQGRSQESNTKRSIALIGHVVSGATRQKLSKSLKGKGTGPKSEETRKRMSEAQKGKVISKEHRAKIAAGNRGRVTSTEVRQKQSASAREYLRIHPDVRQNQASVRKGIPRSIEVRQKIKDTKQLYPYFHNEERRRKISVAVNKAIAEGRHNPPINGYGTPTIYRGVRYSSKWEAGFVWTSEKYLQLGGWIYHPPSFKLSNGTHYNPDFWNPGFPILAEPHKEGDSKKQIKVDLMWKDHGLKVKILQPCNYDSFFQELVDWAQLDPMDRRG